MSGVGAVGSAGGAGMSMGSAGGVSSSAAMSGVSGVGVNQGLSQGGISKATKSAQDSGAAAMGMQNPNAQGVQNFNNIEQSNSIDNIGKVEGNSQLNSSNKISNSFDRIETKCEVTVEKESTTWSLRQEGHMKPVALHMHCPHHIDLKEKEMLAKLLLAALLLLKLLELLEKKNDLPLFLVFGGDKNCGIVPIQSLQEKVPLVSNISVESSTSIQSTVEKVEFSSTVEKISSDSDFMNSVDVVDTGYRGAAKDICASMVKSVETTGKVADLSAFHIGQPTGLSMGGSMVGGGVAGVASAGGGGGMGGASGGAGGAAGGGAA